MEPVLRPLLRDRERLLVASPLVADPGTTEDVSVSDELKNLLDPTLVFGLGAHPGELLRRATFGRALTGGRESLAGTMFDVIEKETSPQLAVTEQRVLIYSAEVVNQPGRSFWQRWFGPVVQTARVIHAVEREAVLGAIAAPAGMLRRGRFLLVFADRSACAIVCARQHEAARAVAAIGPPQPQIGAEERGAS